MNETTAVLTEVVHRTTFQDAITVCGVGIIILMFILGIAVAVAKYKDKKEGKL